MAIIRTGDIREIIRARAYKSANYSQEELDEIRRGKEEFVRDMVDSGSRFVSSAEFSRDRMFSDSVVQLSKEMELMGSPILFKDEMEEEIWDFIPIEVDNIFTEDISTKIIRASHPRVQRLQRKGLNLIREEDERIEYEDVDLLDNDVYMNTYNGSYNNPYSETVIEEYWEMNSLGIDNTFTEEIKEKVMSMNETIDLLVNLARPIS